jgi:NADPH-dependent 2,4-dienoyl-CoA reductase/sulfur reductase-like enzyme
VSVLRVTLAVIGAGPAGLEAAATAAERGVSVALVDSRERPGGQYYRQPPAAFALQDRSRHRRDAERLLKRAGHPLVRHVGGVTVWGMFPAAEGWEIALDGPGGFGSVLAPFVILAPGAYDRPVPFPGWTLPGVLTAGGAQGLLKTQRVLPGRRFLLSGTGPLQLAVAAALVQNGGEVVAVLEGARVDWHALQHATAAWGQWTRLAEGLEYAQALRAARVPVRTGWAVAAAHGDDEVKAATITRLDADWRPIPGTQERVEVDTVVVGYGFVPSTELSRLAECEHTLRPELGGLVPVRDERLLTCQPGLYVAGDAGGITGAAAARIEGRLAALSVCRRLGIRGADERAIGQAIRGLERERRFARALAAVFSPGPGLNELATDDTLICRCENVTLGEIRKAVRGGARAVNEVKGLTCVGMGNCQGRTCGTLVPRLVARELAALGCQVPPKADLLTMRPPIHPLSLQALSEYAAPDEREASSSDARA